MWEKNYKTDIGVENWADGSYYQGSFKNGKKDGIGFYKWPNDIVYQGEWSENKIEGYVIKYLFLGNNQLSKRKYLLGRIQKWSFRWLWRILVERWKIL